MKSVKCHKIWNLISLTSAVRCHDCFWSREPLCLLSFKTTLVSWWRNRMERFLHYWPFAKGFKRSPVGSPHKDQWRGALIFLWYSPEQTVEETIETPVIWDAIAIIMMMIIMLPLTRRGLVIDIYVIISSGNNCLLGTRSFLYQCLQNDVHVILAPVCWQDHIQHHALKLFFLHLHSVILLSILREYSADVTKSSCKCFG